MNAVTKSEMNWLRRRLGQFIEISQRIVDDAEAGENYGLEAWHLVVRTELIDKLQEILADND